MDNFVYKATYFVIDFDCIKVIVHKELWTLMGYITNFLAAEVS